MILPVINAMIDVFENESNRNNDKLTTKPIIIMIKVNFG